MINRIKEIIIEEGLTSGSFADTIGVQRSSVSHILNGRNKPSLDFIIKTLEAFPHLNMEWLLLGQGSMLGTTDHKGERPQIKEPSIFSSFPEATTSVDSDTSSELPIKEELKREIFEKNVDRIVIFYTNRTFVTYIPASE